MLGLARSRVASSISLALVVGCTGNLDPIVSDNAKVLGDEAKQATVSAGSLVFPRDGNDDLAGIPNGAIVVSDWQGGYLRRVMDVQDAAGKLTLMTEQASLRDVVEQGETHVTLDLASAMAPNVPGAGLVAGAIGTTFDVPLQDKEIYSDPSIGLSVRISGGELQLSPSLDLGLTIQNGTSFHAIVGGDITAKLNVVASCTHAVDKTFDVTLWESPEFTIPLPSIGPIPVTATGKLTVHAGINVTAMGQVTVTMGASSTTHLDYGVRYENGAWQQQGDASADWTPVGPTVTTDVEAHAKIYLSAGVEVGLYGGLHLLKLGAGGVVGVTVDPYVQFDYPAADQPQAWELRGGFEGHYFASLSILDETIAQIEQPGDLLFDNGKVIATDGTLPMQAGDCADGYQDGSETDIDCGGASGAGSCAPCDVGWGCITGADCASGVCTGGTCVTEGPANCTDNVWDADEAGTDCGGSCAGCAGDNCQYNIDCASGQCDLTTSPGTCLAPASCFNGVQDPNETDVDCGGACAPIVQCSDGQRCANLIDCYGYACPGETDFVTVTGTCASVPLNCFDCMQDGDEDGIDCGGSCSIEPELACTSQGTSNLYPYLCE